MEDILREELEIVVNRERDITIQEEDVTETVRKLAETVGVCPFIDSETPVESVIASK